MLAEITPAKVAQAARLVRRGDTYDLSHPLDEHIPAFPGRTFRQSLVTSAHQLNPRRPDAGPEGWGENNLNWITEVVYATFQMGTHLDGLNHLQMGQRFYGGYTLSEIAEEYGTNQLGMETVPQIVTRGVLVNIAALHGVDRLERGQVITVADVEAAMASKGLQIECGDALLFHTGWGGHWASDNAAYLSGQPGPGLELASWMALHGVVLSGCDTWSFGPVPFENLKRPFEVPQMLNVEHGVFIVENLHTAELAKGNLATEFMLVLSHAKVRGATGAWVAPLAIV
jgi:kynurenine formamidase